MEPKEKAKELVDRFDFEVRDLDGDVSHTKEEAKQCALICVDEILQELDEWGEVWMKIRIKYWNEVKQEIEKL